MSLNILKGIRIKGEMSFAQGHRGFSSILWVSLDEVPKLKELYGEPWNVGKELYMTDARGWRLNLVEYIVIIGTRVKTKGGIKYDIQSGKRRQKSS